MPRGVARSLEQKLAPIEEKIAELKSKIKALEDDKRRIVDEDKTHKLQKLLTVVDEFGMSIEEAIEKLAQ